MRPSDGRISLWPAVVITVVFTLAALSVTPTVKLNNAPPYDFVALRASAAGPKTEMAEKYWEVAARVINGSTVAPAPCLRRCPQDLRYRTAALRRIRSKIRQPVPRIGLNFARSG